MAVAALCLAAFFLFLNRTKLGTWIRAVRHDPETATSLGERRQLVIVDVEGRRFLLGVTQSTVALVTELQAAPPVAEVPRV